MRQKICQFSVCISLSRVFRHSKPFNPLLGETFEYVRPDLGYYCVTEQVSAEFYTHGCVPTHNMHTLQSLV